MLTALAGVLRGGSRRPRDSITSSSSGCPLSLEDKRDGTGGRRSDLPLASLTWVALQGTMSKTGTYGGVWQIHSHPCQGIVGLDLKQTILRRVQEPIVTS